VNLPSDKTEWPADLEEPKRPVHPDAPTELVCETCGGRCNPVVTKPKWGTAQWRDDPAPYLACPRGHFLGWMSVDEDRCYHWSTS
jgi:hypothetical protein